MKKTLFVLLLLIPCIFVLTACGGVSNFFKKNDNGIDNKQNNDTTNNDTANVDNTQEEKILADYSWEEIAEISASGKASKIFSAGDEIEIQLSVGEKIVLVILGFNHDDLADGSGKAGITFGVKELLTMQYKMTTTQDGFWSTSLLRTETLPLIFSQLPVELQETIKPVNKYTPLGSSSTAGSETTVDNLFLFSQREITGSTSGNPSGSPYEYWKDVKNGSSVENRIKILGGYGIASDWHVRTYWTNTISYIALNGSTPSGNSIATPRGVCFGFCV